MRTRIPTATAYGLAAVLCWSTVATAFKLALQTLTPLQLVLIAAATSWLFLIVWLLVRAQLRVAFAGGLADVARAVGFGLLNPLLYYLVLFAAYDRLPAQEAQALNYTWALTMALLAIPVLGQRMRIGELLAALVSYAGVWVIATRGAVFQVSFADPLGVGLALLSTLLWASYWLLNTVVGKQQRKAPAVVLFENFSCALPLIVMCAWWQGELLTLDWFGVAAGAYVGIFEMGLAFVLWQTALARSDSAAQISTLIFLAPPISLLLIYLVLGEAIALSTVLGLALILVGLAVQQRLALKSTSPAG